MKGKGKIRKSKSDHHKMKEEERRNSLYKK